MRRLAGFVLFTVILPLAAAPLAPGRLAATPSTTASGPTAHAASRTVTLITGDRVTLTAANPQPTVRIEPAHWPGRRVNFATWYVDGAVRVVPSDVARLVPSVLDPHLFDVTALLRAGYDDRSTTGLPLIVQPANDISALTTMDTPAWTIRALPSIGARAMWLPKAAAAHLGAQLTAQISTLATGRARIWLDDRVWADVRPAAIGAAGMLTDGTPTSTTASSIDPLPDAAKGHAAGKRLDDNLIQVNAPAAWAAGLSGAGVRVAVLDTGVDPTHPDLAGQIVAAQDFTGSGDATDHNGHGTHVASLVAGTGAASGGERRGVAFGAALLSGKVLDDDGTGQVSAIIAGMEWAVAQGAKMVNLSLGSGTPSTGQDPLSLAVNHLSAAHGVLFVVSAGNTGPGTSSIGAPAAADAALAVAAVDRHDRLANFSSRGPRPGDYAIKPDLAAPGVNIVAARAAGTSLGQPISDHYTRLSGTSMAAPHVSGAAALLAEQHPQWSGEQLKSALLGSTAPLRSGVFEAGAGRLDVAAAVAQRLLGQPVAISLGLIGYPQAGLPPVTRAVTVANNTNHSVTVDLAATLTAPDGRPAPAGMASVSPTRITVPANGTESATVSVAVAFGAFGAFSGTLTATAPGLPPLRVPLGLVKESTRHVVTLRAVDRTGAPPPEMLVTLVNLTDVTASPPDPVLLVGGTATVRLVPGFYLVTGAIPTVDPDGGGADSLRQAGARSPLEEIVPSVAIATRVDVNIDHDGDVVLDARASVPLSASVSHVDTVPVDVRVFVAVRDKAGHRFVLGYDTSAQDVIDGRLLVQPTEAAHHGEVELSSKWRLDTVGGGPTYDLVFAGPRFPSMLNHVVSADELARVENTYRAPTVPIEYREARFVFTDLNPVSVAAAQQVPGMAPVRRTEYLTAGPKYAWFQCATVVSPIVGGIGDYCQTSATYHRQPAVAHDWLRAPLRTVVQVFRSPTAVQIGMNDLGDDAGHSGSIAGFAFAHQSFALYRNGVLIAEGANPVGVHRVPAGAATFQLTRTLELPPELLPLSTRVESSWTFTAAPRASGDPVAVPIVDAALHVPIDANSGVPAATPLPVTVTASRHTTVFLSVSTDYGASWTAVELRRHGSDSHQATLPAHLLYAGALVSIRMVALDRDGNRFEQTILRGFAVTS